MYWIGKVCLDGNFGYLLFEFDDPLLLTADLIPEGPDLFQNLIQLGFRFLWKRQETDMMTTLNLSEIYRMKCKKTDAFILPPFNIVLVKTGDICIIQFHFFLTPLKRTTTASSGEENTHNRWSWSGHFDAWTRVLGIFGHLGVQNILFHHF